VTEQSFDPTVPNVARVYDYMLGGKDNFAADREFAARLIEVRSDFQLTARENRAFLGRVVRYLASQGIQQFLDIGTGLPTSENVHQVAKRIDPNARIAYVDNDLVVVRHAEALLARHDKDVAVVHADLRDPGSVLESPQVRELINWDEPVAILMMAILHFVPDDEDPYQIVARYVDRLPARGYLAISHAELREGIAEVARMYTKEASSRGAQGRRQADIERFFTGLDLVEPGVVNISQWHPDHSSVYADPWFLGGVAIKR
jgi:trans-aconitate methyltransferase